MKIDVFVALDKEPLFLHHFWEIFTVYFSILEIHM